MSTGVDVVSLQVKADLLTDYILRQVDNQSSEPGDFYTIFFVYQVFHNNIGTFIISLEKKIVSRNFRSLFKVFYGSCKYKKLV